jgi:hypothetical protein
MRLDFERAVGLQRKPVWKRESRDIGCYGTGEQNPEYIPISLHGDKYTLRNEAFATEDVY